MEAIKVRTPGVATRTGVPAVDPGQPNPATETHGVADELVSQGTVPSAAAAPPASQ